MISLVPSGQLKSLTSSPFQPADLEAILQRGDHDPLGRNFTPQHNARVLRRDKHTGARGVAKLGSQRDYFARTRLE